MSAPRAFRPSRSSVSTASRVRNIMPDGRNWRGGSKATAPQGGQDTGSGYGRILSSVFAVVLPQPLEVTIDGVQQREGSLWYGNSSAHG